CQHHYTYPYSF
nr:immunoglobulin light chain junction region [Macaca mulatta]MOW74378.1 immunoglobulin light chain junction region [Macaca mulatta]